MAEGKYVLFDLPGQVELFNMHDALREVVAAITGPEWNLRLCTVHLIDSHLCADPTKYIAALMLSLSSMLHLETPHLLREPCHRGVEVLSLLLHVQPQGSPLEL